MKFCEIVALVACVVILVGYIISQHGHILR